MRDCWYGDNRDIVKWSVLYLLAEAFAVRRVLQIAYYRPCEVGTVVVDGMEHGVPEAVSRHFRDIQGIIGMRAPFQVTLHAEPFEDREAYLNSVLALLEKHKDERRIVFLDLDTGLQPERRHDLRHVLESEAAAIWNAMAQGDVYVFYQHMTNRAGRPWIDAKREQLERALAVSNGTIKVASGPSIAHDVAFFYAEKP